MPRKPRIEFPGAFYHVMARGNKKEDIFLESAGKKRFLRKLREYKKRHRFTIYAYALMDNHIHLLVETGDVPLSKIMQGLLQSHTQWSNKKYRTRGHLFQGRYKAILCDKDAYLIALACYIHANPVRSGLVDDPSNFSWSSHRAYLGLEKNEVVDVEFVLAQLTRNKSKAIRLYEKLVREYLNHGTMDELYELRDQRVLGSEKFFDDVMKKAEKEKGNLDGILRNKELSEISRAIEILTGVTTVEMQGTQRTHGITRARALFIRLAVLFAPVKRKDIAKFLKRVPAALSYIERKITEEDLWASIRKLKW